MVITPDPIAAIPDDPDVIRRLIADHVRQADLLRGLLKLADRKRAYKQQGKSKSQATIPSDTNAVSR